jgi:hypothetical protein
MKTFYPGTRLKVFNSRVYQNDVDTPLSMTMQWATVVHWYGEETRFGRYHPQIQRFMKNNEVY